MACPSNTAIDEGTGTVSPAEGRQIVDLRSLSPPDLEPLLVEETAEWRSELDWDFSKSADLVRKFSAARRLCGAAMLDCGEVAGYGYTGFEDDKGLIGGAWVRPAWRRENAEAVLLRVLFDVLIGISGVRRIESQLLLVRTASAETLQRRRPVQLFERMLMTRDASIPLPSDTAPAKLRFRIEPWDDRHRGSAATAISLAYRDHIDSRINDRYRTVTGASRFLHDLVEFSGATFHRPASYVAFDRATSSLAGISLSTFVANDVAHIAELCVSPQYRRAGLGYELLRKSIETLRSAGAKRISLTVTTANESAVRLYERCGFREKRRFWAFVWERS